MASSTCMKSLRIVGNVWGKASSRPAPCDTRVVLPLGGLALLIDRLLELRVNYFLEVAMPEVEAVWHGARPGTQCQDVAHCAQVCIEKCLDAKSTGGILQGDARRYYDSICLFKVGRRLMQRGMPKADVAAIGAFPMVTWHCIEGWPLQSMHWAAVSWHLDWGSFLCRHWSHSHR